MTISIWRYSHLTLAVSSFIFILVAAITGIILAIEPISNKLQPFSNEEVETISVAKTVAVLKENYDEVTSLEVDANNFVLASIITENGKGESFYINPLTGKKIGEQIQKKPIYKFATNLHRSLFLKQTGRFFVALASFLLFLIAFSGSILIIKRQGGFKKFFFKIVNENFYQYYHIIFGRIMLIPIIIITITGVYLSLEKFDLLPQFELNHKVDFDNLNTSTKISVDEFPVFQNIFLNNVKYIEFPFSSDVEDYYILALSDREIVVNQITGELLSEIEYPFSKMASYYSFILHTGQGSIGWSLVLLIATIAILFFIYSGFKLTIKRRNQSPKLKNTFHKDNAEFIILVGSEAGNTFSFAKAFCEALITQNKSVYITELNQYSSYKNAKHIIVFTSTYGEGDPPTNAKKFERLLLKINQENILEYSVVGLGSLAYPDYCKYAIDIDNLFKTKENLIERLPLYKINNQSFESFKTWYQQWSKSTGISLNTIQMPKRNSSKNDIPFTVKEKTTLNNDDTFLLRLSPNKRVKFNSGDLLSVTPTVDNIERLYSIGRINKDIILSVKKHDYGVVSQYFNTLEDNNVLKASIKKNRDFHFPKKAKDVIMISNGTGIGPFLGMLDDVKDNQSIHFFWGGRTKESFKIYKPFIKSKTINNLHIAYSQEEKKQYVQDLLISQKKLLIRVISSKGVIMICGSVAMQNQVLKIIKTICEEHLDITQNELEKNKQLKLDCY